MASAAPATSVVERVLRDVRLPALLVIDGDPGPVPSDVTVIGLADPRPDVRARTVVLVVGDLAALRQVARAGRRLGAARHVVCVVRQASAALTLRPHASWPAVESIEAVVTDGDALTSIEFAERVPVHEVVRALADAPGHDGLRVAWDLVQIDDKVPADVMLAPGEAAESPVLGRAPVVVLDETWEPVDETVINPIGFVREASAPVIDVPADVRLGPALVAALRPHLGVRIEAGSDERLVAGLAMAGVPLVGPGQLEVDLTDSLAREEHSVRLRRGALAQHSLHAWRTQLANRAGVRAAADPTVSLLLATRRPEQLEFALVQVARQRGADMELVLAAHGFTPDPGEVASLLDGFPHTMVTVEAEAILGEVLRAATDAASGDLVMKVDDDDWYGPDVVADLLLARRYSQADLVGMPAEVVYLESRDVTVRRRGPTENFGRFVAGGTLMLGRTTLRELGGFRPLRYNEDARLLDSLVRAGGSIYRTHGLGYVLRRRATGHTWSPGDDYFLRPESLAAQWPGFRPSALVEAS
ncbi:MAG: hypothetical protein WB767_04080 [Nocardioides sp.]